MANSLLDSSSFLIERQLNEQQNEVSLNQSLLEKEI